MPIKYPEDPRVYEMAKRIAHEAGYDWTDPRDLKTHKAPKPKAKVKTKKKVPTKKRRRP